MSAATEVAVEANAVIHKTGYTAPTMETATDPDLKNLLVLAFNTKDADVLPFTSGISDDTNPVVGTHSYFLTAVGGKPALAYAGDWAGGPAVDSAIIGIRVELWQKAAGGESLVPIAVYHFKTMTGTVESVATAIPDR